MGRLELELGRQVNGFGSSVAGGCLVSVPPGRYLINGDNWGVRSVSVATLARAIVSSMVAGSLMLGSLASALAAEGLSRAEYDACQSREEGAFRSAIESVTQDALTRSLAVFDYKGSVNDAWRKGGLDEIIDKRVDLSVAEIASETSWSVLLQSLANSDRAQELAKAVAERVYRSEAIKAGIEALAVDVGKQLGRSLEFASQDAAAPAIACLKAFLGPRYGTAVAGAVTGEAEKEFGIDSSKGKASVNSGAVLSQSSDGIAGAAILLVRRQLANMAQRVGQRMVGSVLSRLVSVAAGGVGAILIAKDIWELRAGVLPIIATEMKSKATKEQVRAELAKSIAEQIGEHSKEVGVKTAERIIEIWQEFRRAHAKTLEIADRNEGFRTFLDQTKSANLPRLDQVVSIVLGSEGEPAILKRLGDGSLNTAVNLMPMAAVDIAREVGSIDQGIKWAALAADRLPSVAELELHRRAKADDFTKASFGRLLALDDKLAITRLAGVNRDARETLFELEGSELRSLARALTEGELSTLARYLTGLEKNARERVLRAVALQPSKMQTLASASVRDGVLSSRDQLAAADMMLRSGAGSAADILADARSVFEGRISPMLLWERHPLLTLSLIVPLLIVLMLVRRIFRPRRPRMATGQPPTGPTVA